MSATLTNLLVRLWRLTALGIAAWMLHRRALPPIQSHHPIELSKARAFFPAATTLEPQTGGAMLAKDADDNALGLLVTTSPAADGVVGYAGPSNLLVALDKTNRIIGIQILESADTPEHVEALRQNPTFANSLLGWTPATAPPPRVDGTAGATLTGLAMVEGVAQRLGGKLGSLRFPEPIAMEEVATLFPSAKTTTPDIPRQGWLLVQDADGKTLGYVLRTSPAADGILGYAGPSECLVAVAPDRETLLAVKLRKSFDTEEYVERMVDDGDYLKSLTRWKVAQWPKLDFAAEKIEGVAGATMTSYAVAEGLRERFRRDSEFRNRHFWDKLGMKDFALLGILVGALFLAFSKWRGERRVRMAWQAVVVIGLGLWLGQFVSLGLLAGWARHGLPWGQAAPLVLLAGGALLVPWAGRRQVYCHHVCAHGAAQEWLGRLHFPKWTLPTAWHRVLKLAPSMLLGSVFLMALSAPRLALGNFEPFDAWILGFAALPPAILAILGLLGSLFVPMAYCKYGCPTGALLDFVRSSSSVEKFTMKDAVAALLLVGGAFLVLKSAPAKYPSPATSASVALNPQELRGAAFGTTWSLKLRSAPNDLSTLRTAVSSELERIEATLSHWRPGSETSRFNANRSLEPQPVSEELVKLVRFAQQLSRASNGAYDLTVAPLVNAWGYGPSGDPNIAPSQPELSKLLQAVGWEKVEIGEDGHTLRKTHPDVSLDLGSILQGYACDRVAQILREKGCGEYLVEVGGELLARGNWSVAIENPADAQKPLQVLQLKDAALATSGLARARHKLSGKVVSHIISPKTGYPSEGGIEVCSVEMATCLEADGWATTLIASGLPDASNLIQKEKLRVWLQDSTGAWRTPQ
jgi:NosR/NirI family transcriptional regulator, nitrous oxide reductase regulator